MLFASLFRISPEYAHLCLLLQLVKKEMKSDLVSVIANVASNLLYVSSEAAKAKFDFWGVVGLR